jgi:DNA-binding NarL/FixJ family response regulator
MNHQESDPPVKETIKVLLVDDEILIRSGLRNLLSVHPRIEVIGEARDGAEAVELARRLQPDVIVMDVTMPGMDGVTATRQITADDFSPDPDHTVKVIILTSGACAPEHVFATLRAGASGYLPKDAAAELATAIECVAGGLAYLAPQVTPGVFADIASRSDPAKPVAGIIDRLTPREREILILMARGLVNEVIAKTLFLSVATVKTHVCRILMKLDVDTRTQAVVVAYQSGLMDPGA